MLVILKVKTLNTQFSKFTLLETQFANMTRHEVITPNPLWK